MTTLEILTKGIEEAADAILEKRAIWASEEDKRRCIKMLVCEMLNECQSVRRENVKLESWKI